MENKVLELKNVTASYKEGKENKEVLREVSFSIYEGEIVGLLGDSGSGKTTLCKCILKLLKEYQGEVIHYTDNPQMIFQDPFGSLNPKKKIGWILEEPLKVKRIKKEKVSEEVPKRIEINEKTKWNRKMRQKKVAEALNRVNLPIDFCQRYPRELSGGQRQRVSIALALITGAKFILADEPLSALDVTVQAQIIKLLKKLQKEEGISILFVSHDIDVVADLCQRVLIIEDGELREAV
jgi:peptide/nickel transport system ATP-binding protein